MATVVVPFRAGGKSRLPTALRSELARAMLADVIVAATSMHEVRVVTSDAAAADESRALGADVVGDPGGGQGAAVAAAISGIAGACLVVNADLPCATSASLERLAAHGAGCVPAGDGTTNALALPDARSFVPAYGPGSAARFQAAGLVPVSIRELEYDVDTLADLEQLPLPVGRRTALICARLAAAVLS